MSCLENGYRGDNKPHKITQKSRYLPNVLVNPDESSEKPDELCGRRGIEVTANLETLPENPDTCQMFR